MSRFRFSIVFATLVAFMMLFLMPIATTTTASAKTNHPMQARTWNAVVGLENNNLAVQGMLYAPNTLYINHGDTVHWLVQSRDIHTVTFPKSGQPLPAFNPKDPTQTTPQGGPEYDGHNYFNSGLMSLDPNAFPPFVMHASYSLRFNTTGRFDYFCLVHGVMMHGVIFVRPADTPYPQSAEDVSEQITDAKRDVNKEGDNLRERADAIADSNSNLVVTGIGSMPEVGMVEYVRFVHKFVRIELGSVVKFKSFSMMPHTVSIGSPPDPFSSVGDANNYTGGTFNRFIPPGTNVSIRFNKAGAYTVFCQFHDSLGMSMTIIVTP